MASSKRIKLAILDMSTDVKSLPEGEWTQTFLQKALLGDLTISLECDIFSLPQNQWPPEDADFDGIVITGSYCSVLDADPWHQQLTQIVHKCVNDNHVPLLGICYGAQFMALSLFGREHVCKMPTPEFGIKKVTLSAEQMAKDPILEGLPEEFFITVSHNDGFTMPDHIPSLATTKLWPNHGFRCIRDGETTNCWAIQFHPEITEQSALDLYSFFTENDPTFAQKVSHEGSIDTNKVDVGGIIASNFVKVCTKTKQQRRKGGPPEIIL